MFRICTVKQLTTFNSRENCDYYKKKIVRKIVRWFFFNCDFELNSAKSQHFHDFFLLKNHNFSRELNSLNSKLSTRKQCKTATISRIITFFSSNNFPLFQ